MDASSKRILMHELAGRAITGLALVGQFLDDDRRVKSQATLAAGAVQIAEAVMVELANRGYIEEENPSVTDAADEIAALVGRAAALGVVALTYMGDGMVSMKHRGVMRRFTMVNGHLPMTNDLVAAIREDVEKRDDGLIPAIRGNHPPMHPGEYLREDFLPAIGMTEPELALRAGIDPSDLEAVLDCRAPLTKHMLSKLSDICGGDRLAVLGRLQDRYNEWQG